jgi:diguanylate cyclase (GGDEF)-like protein
MYFDDKRLLRVMQGMLLSVLSPLGLIALQMAFGDNLHRLLAEQSGIYLYMLLGTAAAFALFGYYVGNSEERLEDLAIHDSLTGLYNKRFFEARLPEEYARSSRHHRNLSLILIDIDHFKPINDTHGHAFGDHVLAEVAKTLALTARKDESVARVGGEEFCIILTDCGERSALVAAERFQRAIRGIRVTTPQGEPMPITASSGVVSSETTPGNEWQLYQVADAAMYRAKKAGRDQIAIV